MPRRHHRFSDESGQSAVEFALVLPLLLLVLLGIVEFGRAYNASNDLNQMAAAGARFAAVGNYPGSTSLVQREADTGVTQAATVTLTYPQGCAVGNSVTATATAPITLAHFLGIGTISLHGRATMRIERVPAGGCPS